MSLASLEAFLEQAHADSRLQELLVAAPDAAAVAAIAQAAGYPVSELDLWQASAASPEEIHPSDPDDQLSLLADVPPGEAAFEQDMAVEQERVGALPDPWFEDEPLARFLHQAQGDEALQQALASAPDAAAVAAIAQAAGYPVSELDLWRASEASPEEVGDALAGREESVPEDAQPLQAPTPQPSNPATAWPVSDQEALLGFLHQAQGDEALQQALASAPDAAAVAAIAQAAGYPVSELDLWRASGGIHADDLLPPEPDLSPIEAPLARFLLVAEHDPDLLDALAGAEDAAMVAAIAQAAGFPITVADLWAATEAVPQELVEEDLMLEEWMVVTIEDDGELA